MRYPVAFQANPDETHCFQAVMKMIAEFYWPEKEYSWDELDQITGKEKDLWTWPNLGYVWLQQKGLQIIVEELFDHQSFIEKGGKYLIDFAGKVAGEESIKHSNIPLEIERAKQAVSLLTIRKLLPNLQSLREYLEKGYLIICNVNANRLNNKTGYVGHFVLIVGFEGDDLILHDPGKPPHPFRRVSVSDFELAWGDPEERMKNLVAIKKNSD